jgi:flagellar hook assembly protein FlgD
VDAFLFPNPTQSGRSTSGGQFVVNALGDPVNTLVKIYTLSGKLIRSLETFGGQGQIQVPWDGFDSKGYPLANGTYYFRVQLNVRDPEGDSSAQRKASTEGRFVILNRGNP